MPPFDSTVRKLPEPAMPASTAAAPQNIEAEQALLGAILVNNEAFYRVSDFLEPRHFFEPIHQQIYEVASNLIRAGKVATPVTLKTFLPAEIDVGGPERQSVPRAAGRRSDHRDPRRRLRAHDRRPVGAAQSDPHRRGHGQCGV
jgi:hypothetical protein